MAANLVSQYFPLRIRVIIFKLTHFLSEHCSLLLLHCGLLMTRNWFFLCSSLLTEGN